MIRAYFLGREVGEVREFESGGLVRIIMKDTRDIYLVPSSMVVVKYIAKRPVQLPLAV